MMAAVCSADGEGGEVGLKLLGLRVSVRREL